jgi:hypothetical protein
MWPGVHARRFDAVDHPKLINGSAATEQEEADMGNILKAVLGAAMIVGATGVLLPNMSSAQDQSNAVGPKSLFEAARAPNGMAELTLGTAGTSVHIFPIKQRADALLRALAAAPTPLLYHSGGQIMPSVTIYVIFWEPPKLQTGAPAPALTATYQNLQTRLMTDYTGHGVGNNNTQYYQTVGGVTSYVKNAGSFGGSYVDASSFPASGCNDSATPGNCITDAQIQTEVKKVVALKNWHGGLGTIFFLYTVRGEGSCFDSSSTSCAYTAYCAYHGAIAGTTPIIYANMPYGDPTNCQTPGTPSPSGDSAADTAATSASHELTESITDPRLNAWFTAGGAEIGDLCAYNYGTNTWDGAKANQMWSGHFYELQQEYNNHVNMCVQIGP